MPNNKNKKVIMLDLDGVLNTYTGSFDENYISPIREGVPAFLNELSQSYEVKVFTARSIDSVKKWLSINGILDYVSDVTNKKEPCWLIIDDRCITFDGNYNNLIEKIENFKPWYKK